MSSPRFRILAADRGQPIPIFDRGALDIDAEVIYGRARTAADLAELVEEADAVMVFRTPVSAEAIARMKRCKVILRQGIGVDLVDVPAATRAGIFVTNLPDYCVNEVAAHAVMLMLASVRNLMDFDRAMRESGWGFNNVSRKVPSLEGLRLGLVGLGKIGRAVARMAAPLGMTIRGYDPYVAGDIFSMSGVGRIRQLDDLLRDSDVVSLHAPLTPETRGMIGARELALMPPQSHLINTARGKIVDLTALAVALEKGPLAAAALDVFEEEPVPAGHPILGVRNIIVTPHVAFYSEKSVETVLHEAIAEVVRTLRGERPLNLVNPEAYAHRA